MGCALFFKMVTADNLFDFGVVVDLDTVRCLELSWRVSMKMG